MRRFRLHEKCWPQSKPRRSQQLWRNKSTELVNRLQTGKLEQLRDSLNDEFGNFRVFNGREPKRVFCRRIRATACADHVVFSDKSDRESRINQWTCSVARTQRNLTTGNSGIDV